MLYSTSVAKGFLLSVKHGLLVCFFKTSHFATRWKSCWLFCAVNQVLFSLLIGPTGHNVLCTLLFIYSFPVQQTRQFVCESFLTLCKSRFHLFFVRFLFLAFVCNFFWRARPPQFSDIVSACVSVLEICQQFLTALCQLPRLVRSGDVIYLVGRVFYYFVGRFVCLSFSYLVSFFVLVSRALKFKSF